MVVTSLFASAVILVDCSSRVIRIGSIAIDMPSQATSRCVWTKLHNYTNPKTNWYQPNIPSQTQSITRNRIQQSTRCGGVHWSVTECAYGWCCSVLGSVWFENKFIGGTSLVPAHFELISIFRVHFTLARNAYYNLLRWDVQMQCKSCEIWEASFGFATTSVSITLFEFWTQNDGMKIPQTNLMQKTKDTDCNLPLLCW